MSVLAFTSYDDWLAQVKDRMRHALFTPKQQQAFLLDVYTLVEDGVPANKAVEAIGRISTGHGAEVAQAIVEKVAQGKSIAEGMMGWFPDYIIELIRAGEGGGTLNETLRSAAESLGRKNQATGSLFSALTYPMVVIIMAFSVMVYMNKSIFTQFRSIKPLEQWPAIGQNLVGLADFMTNWWWLLILVFTVIIFFIARLLREYTGMYRDLIDHIPVLSLYRQLTAARFMETLGLLIANGIVFKDALRLMQFKASPYLISHLMYMTHRLGTGKSNIAEVLDTGLIAPDDIIRLHVTAASKGFEHALVRLGKRASEKVAKTVGLIASILGGILMAVGAGLAIFMVLAIYSVGSSLAN